MEHASRLAAFVRRRFDEFGRYSPHRPTWVSEIAAVGSDIQRFRNGLSPSSLKQAVTVLNKLSSWQGSLQRALTTLAEPHSDTLAWAPEVLTYLRYYYGALGRQKHPVAGSFDLEKVKTITVSLPLTLCCRRSTEYDQTSAHSPNRLRQLFSKRCGSSKRK